MYEIVMLVLGLALGGVAGLYLGLLRGRSASAADAARLSNNAAALQAALNEVRSQLAAKDSELAGVRNALEVEKVSSADIRARLDAERQNLAEQRRQIGEMQEKLRESFKALSAEALKSSNEQFITLADAKFTPLREQLERYEKQLAELEKNRATAYGGLTEKLTTLELSEQRLVQETSQLVAALRQPGAKGKWGEVTLQRIVELSGMTPHCDFTVQTTQDSGQRPDLIVQLPGGRMLAVDSKVNTSAYLDAVSATTDDERKRGLERYVVAVRTTLKSLSGKEYWKQFTPAPEFVVMFMPGEAFFSAAVSADPDLLIDGVGDRVILASPTTLMALLMAVRHGWQQQQVAENAQRIAEAGRELFDRLCAFVDHLDGIRAGLARAAEAYNRAVGNWAGRTLPSAKKLKELGAAEAGKDMIDLQNMDVPLRALPSMDDQEAIEKRRAG